MTDERSNLLISLETKVRHLIFLYDNIKKERDDLILKLEETEKNLSDTQKTVQEWEIKYHNLKLAKCISVSEKESKQTQNRLSKLEREIEKCIALLNE